MRKILILLAAALLLNGQSPPTETPAPELSADCAVLMTADGQILYEKNAHRRSLIASTTKLMTALVAAEHCSPDETVEIPPACCEIEGSSMYLTAGETYTVEELLTGLLLASGNDAAEALALHCAGSEERFAAWMNEKAAELGMADSHFVNPHGLDDEEHYGSAADLALLMAACMERPELCAILSRSGAEIHGQYYVNHNKLLWRCPGCLGGKTGYTRAAGRCLVSCCEREGTRLYCVTLSAPEDWNDHMAMYDYAFGKVNTFQPDIPPDIELPLAGGLNDTIKATAQELPAPVTAVSENELSYTVISPPFIYAPVKKGDKLAELSIVCRGREIRRVPLYSAEDAAHKEAPAKKKKKSLFSGK